MVAHGPRWLNACRRPTHEPNGIPLCLVVCKVGDLAACVMASWRFIFMPIVESPTERWCHARRQPVPNRYAHDRFNVTVEFLRLYYWAEWFWDDLILYRTVVVLGGDTVIFFLGGNGGLGQWVVVQTEAVSLLITTLIFHFLITVRSDGFQSS